MTVSIGANVQVPCSAVKATGRDREQMYVGYSVRRGGIGEIMHNLSINDLARTVVPVP